MPRAQAPRKSSSAASRFQLLLLTFLPGALAGAHISGLLFFLNPDLPFGLQSQIPGALRYSAVLGLLSMLLLTPLCWYRPASARRVLPWALTTVLVAGAVLATSHAAHFAYLLPPGISQRLLKAGLWLGLAALIYFYTALLHSLHRRRYGLRSQVGLTLLALSSIYIMGERREAFKPELQAPPLSSNVEAGQRPSLLLVGIEHASLDAILPLAEQGHLPFFATVVEEGSHARLETFSPIGTSPHWASLVTGKLPVRHGILGERVYAADFLTSGAILRLIPAGIGFSAWGLPSGSSRPVDGRTLRALPLWEILPVFGVATGVVGWPVSYPLTASVTYGFSDRFFGGETGPLAARPEELAERGTLFRVDPDELDPGVREAFGPDMPSAVGRALARDLWRQSLTAFLLEQRQDVPAVLVMLPGLSEVSRQYFGGFSAVTFEGAQSTELEEAATLVSSYYRLLDDLVAQLWEQMEPPRMLVVVSAYGIEGPGGLRRFLRQAIGQPTLAGSTLTAPDGALLMLGDNIRPATFISNARLSDLLPTILYGLGLPIARDLDGSVLTSAFDPSYLAGHPLTFAPSYQALSLEDTDKSTDPP